MLDDCVFRILRSTALGNGPAEDGVLPEAQGTSAMRPAETEPARCSVIEASGGLVCGPPVKRIARGIKTFVTGTDGTLQRAHRAGRNRSPLDDVRSIIDRLHTCGQPLALWDAVAVGKRKDLAL